MPDGSDTQSSPPPQKRLRVLVACQRCKHRKTKCDGGQPSCSPCTRVSATCIYSASSGIPAPKPSEDKSYIRALENRVAELESLLSANGAAEVDVDHWDRTRPSPGSVDTLSSAVRDLSLSASGFYVGGTSNLSIGSHLAALLGSEPNNASQTAGVGSNGQISGQPQAVDDIRLPDVSMLDNPSLDIALDSYIKIFSWQYPIVHTPKLRKLHQRRCGITDPFEASLLHLVYAIGIRSMELAGILNKRFPLTPDEHYEAAGEWRDSIVKRCDRRTVIFLALTAAYCMRAPRSPGPWMMIGHAMKLCICFGLHRKSAGAQVNPQRELDSRIFWACYCLDIDAAIAMGRPPSISNRDIDAPLPLDMEESSVSAEDFAHAARHASTPTSAQSLTSLTRFVLEIRMKRILSTIQHKIYRVDTNNGVQRRTIDKFMQELDQWRSDGLALFPPESTGQTDFVLYSEKAHGNIVMIQYYSAVRLLLFPRLTEGNIDPSLLRQCAGACIGICQRYKRIHDSRVMFCYTPFTIQSIFLAGLTLMYCVSLALRSDPISKIKVPSHHNAITDCSIMLYVMTERWPLGQRYRDIFENIRTSVFDQESIDNNEGLLLNSLSSTQDIFGGSGMDIERNASLCLSHMIQDIGGESMAPIWGPEPGPGLTMADFDFFTQNSSEQSGVAEFAAQEFEGLENQLNWPTEF